MKALSIREVGELLDRPVSMRALALLRVLVGPVVILHLGPFLDDARHGTIYRDHFYEPYSPWYPELPKPAYVALLVLGALAAVAMSVGFKARLATTITFAAVTYNLFLSTTHFHSNRAYLVIVLGVLTVSRCDRELSVDAWLRRRRGQPPLETDAPGWPVWLLRFEAATIYGASSFSKLIDPDWFGGTVPWQRVMNVHDRLASSPLPTWAVSVLSDRTFHTYTAKVIVATELFIALGLWARATRSAAVWVAVCFHLAIEISASVQVFSFLAVAALVIWAVPSPRDRMLLIDRTNTSHWQLVRLVRALDWLARFRIEPAPPGSPIQVVDRDGTRLEGRPAVMLVLSRLPLAAWFGLPARIPTVARRARPVPPDRPVLAVGSGGGA